MEDISMQYMLMRIFLVLTILALVTLAAGGLQVEVISQKNYYTEDTVGYLLSLHMSRT
jgi:hypothetical protein